MVFSDTRFPLYGKMQVIENPSLGIFYAEFVIYAGQIH